MRLKINPSINFDPNQDYYLVIVPNQNIQMEIRSIEIIDTTLEVALREKVKNEIEINDINDLKVYPNPVDDILNFDIASNTEIKSILIYDLNGRFIGDFTNKIKDRSINVNSLSAGNYVVKIITENSTTKIILKK